MKKNQLSLLILYFLTFFLFFQFSIFNYNNGIIGTFFIFIVSLFLYLVGRYQCSIAHVLFVAFALRLTAIILNNYFYQLPDAVGDSSNFEFLAYECSKDGFLNALSQYPNGKCSQSFFISYIIGIFYSLFGRDILIGQSISLLFGTLSVLITYILTKKLWGDRSAVKASWFVAFFPSLILYSSLIMREPYIVFFLLLALNHSVNFVILPSLRSFFLTTSFFLIASLFHGSIFIGLIVFFTIIIIGNFKKILQKTRIHKITFSSFCIFFLVTSFVLSLFLINLKIPKIGNLHDIAQIKQTVLNKNKSFRGTASYPEWLNSNTISELVLKTPLKILYFTYSPFPWDVKKTSHLIGLTDGIFYLYLSYLILLNKKNIWRDPRSRVILLILLAYIVVYSIAIGNFGTGVRHRSKFVAIFILLAAPFLPKLITKKKKKNFK